jgi:hypothetical protein
MRNLAIAVLALFAGAEVRAACPDPPGYESLRYDEDYSYLADPTCRRDAFDRLKHLPMGGPSRYLSIGGELRVRGEYVHRPDFGIDLPEDQALLGRLLVHADVRLGPSLRGFVQLGSHFAAWREGGDGLTDEDRLDVAQAFADVSTDAGNGRMTARGGRQEVTFGSARLVSTRESPNVRRAFDGGRLHWRSDAASIDAFYLRPVELKRGVFDDRADDGQEFYGLYASVPLTQELGTDLYYLGYAREDARFSQGTAFEDRHSVGMRLFGEHRGADWDIEAVYQFGSFGTAEIAAWTIAVDAGYTFLESAWSPRLGLKADIVSGDADPRDGHLGTFNALYPKLPYFTEAGLVAPANVLDLHPSIDLVPSPGVAVSLGANMLWRHRRTDAFYAPPLVPIMGLSGSNRYVGTQAEAGVEWQVSRHVEFKAWYVRFFAGDAVRRVGGGNVDFVGASLAWKL